MYRKRFWKVFAVVAAAVTAAATLGTPAASADPGGRGPHDRMAGARQIYVGDDDVTIVAAKPQGGGTFTVYRAAPGRAWRLVDELRDRGVVDRSVPAKGVPGGWDPVSGTGDPVWRCPSPYGSAGYLGNSTCSAKVRWRWNGFADPQVYFRDHTSAAWPVDAAVYRWNQAIGVDSYYTTGSCPTGGRHCVNVYNARYDSEWMGYTYIDYDAGFSLLTVVVHLNDKYSSAADNRGTTCHELGHALGLAHNLSTGSCLYESSIAGTDPMLPDNADYNTLRYVLYP
jgi:hypothetical protein